MCKQRVVRSATFAVRASPTGSMVTVSALANPAPSPVCGRDRQEDATSYFREYAIVVSWDSDIGFQLLMDDRYTQLRDGAKTERQLRSEDDYARTLRAMLRVDLDGDVDRLWEAICVRSEARSQEKS